MAAESLRSAEFANLAARFMLAEAKAISRGAGGVATPTANAGGAADAVNATRAAAASSRRKHSLRPIQLYHNHRLQVEKATNVTLQRSTCSSSSRGAATAEAWATTRASWEGLLPEQRREWETEARLLQDASRFLDIDIDPAPDPAAAQASTDGALVQVQPALAGWSPGLSIWEGAGFQVLQSDLQPVAGHRGQAAQAGVGEQAFPLRADTLKAALSSSGCAPEASDSQFLSYSRLSDTWLETMQDLVVTPGPHPVQTKVQASCPLGCCRRRPWAAQHDAFIDKLHRHIARMGGRKVAALCELVFRFTCNGMWGSRSPAAWLVKESST